MGAWRTAAAVAAIALTSCASARAAEIPESGTLDLASQADVRIGGLEESSFTGFAVARAGDVNGDGLADVLVSAPQADARGRTSAGSVFVLFGQKDKAPVDLANLGGAGFRVDGALPGDQAGFSAAPAGDQNGDGLADFVIGAPAAGGSGPGAAYLVYGKKDAGGVDLASLGQGGYRIGGAQPGDLAGFSVGSVGDLNGDGRPELLVGAPRYDVNDTDRVDAGAVFVVFGGAPANVDLAALGGGGFRIDGEGHGFAGWSVDGSGDINGDGLPEVVLGAPFTDATDAPGAGSAYVVWGHKGSAGVDLATLGNGGLRLNGGLGRGPAAGAEDASPKDQGTTDDVSRDKLGEAAGTSVAALGDVSGDGVPDIAVGAQLADRGSRRSAGSVYVVNGTAGGGSMDLASVGTDPAAPGFRVDGAAAGDNTGTGVSPAGDVNGDGRPDMLVSSPLASPLSRFWSGATYVLYGRQPEQSVDLAAIGDAGFRIAGPGRGDTTSRHAVGAGDFNGDGAPDLLLGGPLARPKPDCPSDPTGSSCDESVRGPRAGAAFLVFSPKPVPPPPPDPGQDEETTIDQCTAVRNVEVIVDDSGSMESTDPDKLRRRALEIMLVKPRNEGDVLGALEFGDFADQLFPPEPIDEHATRAIVKRLRELVSADNGGTDYNAAFAAAGDENPAAGARVFITDGGHNAGEYTGGHAGGPPTYVIGLDIGTTGPDAQRLQRIADDTGGHYYPNVSGVRLESVLGRIDSHLNCDTSVDDSPDTIDTDTDSTHSDTPIDAGTYSSDVTVSWDDPDDQLEVKRVFVYRRGNRKPVATISERTIKRVLRSGRRGGHGRLRVSGRAGSTYVTLRVNGLGGLKDVVLRVVVGAKKLKGKSHVVTQVSQSRRRR